MWDTTPYLKRKEKGINIMRETTLRSMLDEAVKTCYKFAMKREVSPHEMRRLGRFFDNISTLIDLSSEETLALAVEAEYVPAWQRDQREAGDQLCAPLRHAM